MENCISSLLIKKFISGNHQLSRDEKKEIERAEKIRVPKRTKVFVSTSHCQRRYQQHKAGGFTIVGRTEIIDMEEGDFEPGRFTEMG